MILVLQFPNDAPRDAKDRPLLVCDNGEPMRDLEGYVWPEQVSHEQRIEYARTEALKAPAAWWQSEMKRLNRFVRKHGYKNWDAFIADPPILDPQINWMIEDCKPVFSLHEHR